MLLILHALILSIVPWSMRQGSVTWASKVRTFGVATATGGRDDKGEEGSEESRAA